MKTLKQWREHRGLTQPDLAKIANISMKTVYNAENGRIRQCSYENVRAITTALGVEDEDVLELSY